MPDGPILIVDDNPANMKLASFVLTSKGYTVRTASNAKEALIEIASFPPRLVLMDIQLPDIDGLELTRRLKAEPATRAIIVVAVTAYAMAGDEDKARRAGCDGYITKPIDTRTLATTVDLYLNPSSEAPRQQL
jgi:CheY-like chemotaxis protein